MKICYEKVKGIDQIRDEMENKLDLVISELECPTWMLGVGYKRQLLRERQELVKGINKLNRVEIYE